MLGIKFSIIIIKNFLLNALLSSFKIIFSHVRYLEIGHTKLGIIGLRGHPHYPCWRRAT